MFKAPPFFVNERTGKGLAPPLGGPYHRGQMHSVDDDKAPSTSPMDSNLAEKARWDETRELLKRALSAWENTEPKVTPPMKGLPESPATPPSSPDKDEFKSLFAELQQKIKELS